MQKNLSHKNNPLIQIWESWQGSIDCGYSQKVWHAFELKQISDQLAEKLLANGIKKGDIIALVLANTAAFPVLLLSCLKTGCNPLLLHVSTTEDELSHIKKELNIDWIIHDFIDDLTRIAKNSFPVSDELKMGPINIHLLKNPFNNRQEQKSKHTAVILHLTSGTYGKNKICIRNQHSAIAEGINYVTTIDIYHKIRIMLTTPLNHAYAYGFGLIASLLTDSTLVIDSSFNPKKILRRLTENPCQILTLVPPMMQSLIYLKKIMPGTNVPLSVFYAGVRCDDFIKNLFEKEYKCNVYTIFGSTETGAIATDYSCVQNRQGVGEKLKNVEVVIENKNQYSDLGDGVGEVAVRSTSMMQKYYVYDQFLEQDIFFKTGDIGYIDQFNNIILTGRIKDVINVNGIKIDPIEIEKIMADYPDVNDAVVYPGSNQDGEEIVSAAITTRQSNFNIQELKKYCFKLLNSFKVPVMIYIVDDLPRTPSGKYLKIKLPNYKKR